MVEMFRITHSRGMALHVEGRQAMVRQLLRMHTERVAQESGFGKSSINALIERMFRSRKNLEPVYRAPWGMKLEQFVDGEWVEIAYDFVPAHLTLDGVTYEESQDA